MMVSGLDENAALKSHRGSEWHL